MLALRLADQLAVRRRERGGIKCPWEIGSETFDPSIRDTDTAGVDNPEVAQERKPTESSVVIDPDNPKQVPLPPSTLNPPWTHLFPETIYQPTASSSRTPSRPLRSPANPPLPTNAQTLKATLQDLISREKAPAGQAYFHTPRALLGLPDPAKKPIGTWGFDEELVRRFPPLKKRNFVCVQEHQATAYHYDLRLQIDGGTFCWAIPKGLFKLAPGSWHYAVQTPIHPISYSVHEGSDGRVFKNGTRCGTLLLDICEYFIGSHIIDRENSPDSDYGESEETGKFEEDKLRHALYGRLKRGKTSRYIKLVLKNGRKFTNHSFTIFQTDATYDSRGNPKKQWIIKLGHGITEPHAYPEDAMKSVKTGRLLEEVTRAGPYYWVPRPDEQAAPIDEGNLEMLQQQQ